MKIKPLLAATLEDISLLKFPYIASYKLDGVRALVIDSTVMSRSLKPIPNRHVQKLFGHSCYNGFDGELIVGQPNKNDTYRTTTSGVMSEDGEPDVTFWAFDNYLLSDKLYLERHDYVRDFIRENQCSLSFLRHELINNLDELYIYEKKALDLGYEGIMLRSLTGRYKRGRATINENNLIKVKKFLDSEAIITGYEELQINNNKPTVNELGRQERSSHKANMVPGNTLGNLLVEGHPSCSLFAGCSFKIGTGFTEELRNNLWNNRESLLGKVLTYKFFPTGVKDKPRFPVFLRFKEG